MKTIVEFTRNAPPYMAGETAGFSGDEAQRLVELGAARICKAPAEVETEPPAELPLEPVAEHQVDAPAEVEAEPVGKTRRGRRG